MKFIALSLIFIGIMMVVVGWVRSNRNCPIAPVEYRYVPRTFVEEQNEPVPLDDLFGKMFREQQPWVGGFSDIYIPRNENINQNFISAQ